MAQRPAMAVMDVLRAADNERVIQAALGKIAAQEDGATQLLSLVLGNAGDCTTPARAAAFASLISMTGDSASNRTSGDGAADQDMVEIVLQIARSGEDTVSGLDLYGASRRMPIVALLRHCGCAGEAQAEAMEDAGFATVGDLIRYCDGGESPSATQDVAADESHCRALMLETAGTFTMSLMLTLLREARALLLATARLPAAGAQDVTSPWIDSSSAREGTAAAAGDSGSLNGGPPFALVEDDDLGDIDDGGPVPGPKPGTHSIGC